MDISNEKAFISGDEGHIEDPTHKATKDQKPQEAKPALGPRTLRELNLPYLRKALKDIVGSMASLEVTEIEIMALSLTVLFDPSKLYFGA